MNRYAAVLAALALVPMSANVHAAGRRFLIMDICGPGSSSGSGKSSTVIIPIESDPFGSSDRGDGSAGDCEKACHLGSGRKRSGQADDETH